MNEYGDSYLDVLGEQASMRPDLTGYKNLSDLKKKCHSGLKINSATKLLF